MLSTLLLFCLIQNIIPQNVSGQKISFSVEKEYTDQIHLHYYKSPAVRDHIRMKLENGLNFTNEKEFDVSIPTVFHLHGWGENAYIGSSKILKEAFLQKKICNLVIFDYSTLVVSKSNPFNYYIAVINAELIGQAIGEFLKQYIPKKQPAKLVKMVSHSLGSQILSIAARKYGPGKLERLTALDPAGPVFRFPWRTHFKATDGKFVDVIHSDGGHFGDKRTVGTADFFPNGGDRYQPGCPKTIMFIPNFLSDCSHRRSYELYAESITNPKAFEAKKCRLNLFKTICCCEDNDIAYMGYYVNTSIRGIYYLSTNSQQPFGRGIQGPNF